jgi:hypothetical protein
MIAWLDIISGPADGIGVELIFMRLLEEVRDLIGDFYDGALTPAQFRGKFAVLFAQSHRYLSEVQNALLEIDGIYADYIARQIEEPELKKRLFEFLPSTRVQVPQITQLSDIWKIPASNTQNNSPRLQSRQSPQTMQVVEIVWSHR